MSAKCVLPHGKPLAYGEYVTNPHPPQERPATERAAALAYQSWRDFRTRWIEMITSPTGLFAYDPTARAHLAADGVKTFTYDPAWVVPARFEPATKPATIDLEIAHHQGTKRVPHHGTVIVRIGDEDYRLQVYSAPGGEYHLSFRDHTSGDDTYPGGRVVFIPFPEGHGGEAFDFTLDLNRAVNGPCVYSHLSACALPPHANTIRTAVTAGEKIAAWMRPARERGD